MAKGRPALHSPGASETLWTAEAGRDSVPARPQPRDALNAAAAGLLPGSLGKVDRAGGGNVRKSNGTLSDLQHSPSMPSAERRSVVRFPVEKTFHAARGGATAGQVFAGRLSGWIGRTLNRAGIPGAIQPIEIQDSLAGHHVLVSVGESFVCLSVNGRDYFFNRLTGRFDGTGLRPG
jgi:hypothetical protein